MTRPELPIRFFPDGEEPNGERVQSYGELSYIDTIAGALLPDEREKLMNSQFGKLLEIPASAAYSGKLVHFLLTRQLQVKKKHEIWFIFGGSPIRFSIDEFEAVTGLLCSKLPKAKKKAKKRKIVPGRYWFKLFDRPDVSVEWVVNRLKKNLVEDKDTRLRLALLALVDGVICPTSGKPKICPIHADLSEEIDKFLNYPWGTTAFDMTLDSIQARGAAKLRKKSTTIQGFPHALQLLLLKAVPVIKDLHFPQPDEDDDSDLEDITNECERLWTIKLDLVWQVDGKSTCAVTHMLKESSTNASLPQSTWSDEEDDDLVANMIQRIKRGQKFNASMFGGGLLPEDGNDERNADSENGSNGETNHETNVGEKEPAVGRMKNKVGEGEVCIQAATKHYVDMKVKRSENRVLKAIAEVEKRLTINIRKCISEAVVRREGMPNFNGEASVLKKPMTDPKPTESATEYGIRPDQVISKVMTKLEGVVGNQNTSSTKPTRNSSKKRKISEDNAEKEHVEKVGPVGIDDDIHDSSSGVPSPKRRAVNISEKRKIRDENVEKECVDKGGSVGIDDDFHDASSGVPSPKQQAFNISKGTIPSPIPGSLENLAPVGSFKVKCTEIFPNQPSLTAGPSENTKQHQEVDTASKSQPTTSKETYSPTVPLNDFHVKERGPDVKDIVPQVDPALSSDVVHGHSTTIVPSNTFGYDLQQLQKIIRITSDARVIDFGCGRKLPSAKVLDIIQLKKDLRNEEIDIIFNSLRLSWEKHPPKEGSCVAAFRDSAFCMSLIEHYGKFMKSSEKGMYGFDESVISECPTGVEKFYCPFAYDKKHWVCLSVDLEEWAITVLDCFASASRGPKVKNALKPLSIMLPYLIRFAEDGSGKKGIDFKPLGILREKHIPQACYARHSGVMSANLAEAHALGGVAMCKLVKITDVFDSAKKYIIDAYEFSNGPA